MRSRDDVIAEVELKQDMEDRFHARLRAVEGEARSLRRTVRTLWAALVVALVAGVAAVAKGPLLGSEPGVLEATRVVLVNAEGQTRGEWLVDETGNARFSLMDREQRERVLLTVRSGGYPGITLANAAGQRRVALGLLPDETTSLVFADGGGIPRAILGLTGAESANLVFADREGVSRIGLGLDGDGIGSVLLPPEDEDEDEGIADQSEESDR